MNKAFLLIFILTNLCFSQNVITVYVRANNDDFSRFEREIIENVLKKSKYRTYRVNFFKLQKFKDAFRYLTVDKSDKNYHFICSIVSLSITKERLKKFDFSKPYMPNRHSLLTKEKNIIEYKLNKFTKIGYNKGSIYEKYAKQYVEKYQVKAVGLDDLYKDYVVNDKTDLNFILADHIDTFTYGLKSLEIVDENKKDELGIMFPKGSILYKDLNRIMAYYFSSPAYIKLIRKYFGDEAVKYFKVYANVK